MSDAELDDEILRLLMQRIYTHVEPVAVMTLLWTASRVDRALDALEIEDDDFTQA